MYLSEIRLFNFRNIQDGNYKFSSGLNVIRGQNGQGKTNLVEAIYLLSFTKSFRTNALQETSRWDTGQSSVFGSFISGEDQAQTTIELGLSIQAGKKQVYRNQQKVTGLMDFLGSFCCICFTPNDLKILKENPSLRRSFVDKHIMFSKPGHISSLVNIQKALANKNSLLKSAIIDKRQYEVWNNLIAEESIIIEKNRVEFLQEIQKRAEKYLNVLSNNLEGLELELISELSGITKEEALARISDKLDREIRLRTSVISPQRDDVEVRVGGIDVRSFASQGQTRSVMIALKLALIDYLSDVRGSKPTIVLDDVESELDRARTEALFSLVNSLKTQVFITGTDCAWVQDEKIQDKEQGNCTWFDVNKGNITRKN